MAFEASSLRLFGLDLTRVGSAFRQGLEGMLRWPALAWLSPPPAVHVQWPDGHSRICRGASFEELVGVRSARCQAVVLPADIALFQPIRLPNLSNSDLQDALELQLQAISPLPVEQLVWGWRIDAVNDDGLVVMLAFALREHVAAWLASHLPALRENESEIWADAQGPVVLRGFGEAGREQATTSARKRLLSLILLSLFMLSLLPAAHLWQLRARVFDAQAQFATLNAQAAPFVAERAKLVRANQQAQAIQSFLDARPDVPWLIETLSAILPDHSWLSRLEVEGRRVRIVGNSDDAAALMESLRARPEITGLRALSPIVRTRSDVDSFNFEFTLVDKVAAP